MVSPHVQTVCINGITLAFQDLGSGFPLVLIGGFASTMDMWNPPVLNALASHFRVIIFDNRGTGFTSDAKIPFSIPLFAEDTVALMDALSIRRAHLLGHSIGASIVQELVLAHPDRADRLILVSGTCGGERMVSMRQEIWETLNDKTGNGLDLANRMFSVLFPREWLAGYDPWKYCPEVHERTSEESVSKQADAISSWPGTYERLPGIRSPTLVVTGSEDVVIPPENAVTLTERIPGARLVQFPGAGHGVMYQCPEWFAGTVLEFLGDKKKKLSKHIVEVTNLPVSVSMREKPECYKTSGDIMQE